MSGKKILGIDLRVTSVKIVEVEKARDKITIKNWGMAEIPFELLEQHPQKEDTQAEILRNLIKSRRIRTREAVVVIGGSEVHVKLFSLYEASRAEAAEVIKWKFAEEIPFPIEEAIIDFYPVREVDDKIDYLAVLIHKKLYREIKYTLSQAGLQLIGITVVPEALAKLFQHQIEQEKKEVLSIIYMGKKTTNISIFRNGHLEFNRELGIGGENITQAMSGAVFLAEGQIEIDREKAEKIKLEYGLPIDVEHFAGKSEIPADQLQAMLKPILKRVQDEVMRTFEYYKEQSGANSIDRIILTGGSALTPNLPQFLSEGLGIPVIVDSGIEKAMPQLSAALGAAMAGPEGINLIPDEYKHFFVRRVQKILQPQYLFFSLVILLIFIYLVFLIQSFNLNTEIKNIEKKMAALEPQLLALQLIESAAEEEMQKKIEVRVYSEKINRLLSVFDEINQLISKSLVINSISFGQNQMVIKGIALGKYEASENILSNFISDLAASPNFKDVRLLEAVKNNEQEKAFNFEISIEFNNI